MNDVMKGILVPTNSVLMQTRIFLPRDKAGGNEIVVPAES